jgi:uncharacterized ferritin-like protein (DUF455 family)
MTVDTDYDVLARMALVPRVLEARGLDVTPKIQKQVYLDWVFFGFSAWLHNSVFG